MDKNLIKTIVIVLLLFVLLAAVAGAAGALFYFGSGNGTAPNQPVDVELNENGSVNTAEH